MSVQGYPHFKGEKMNIPWELLIEALIEMVKMCLENNSSSAVLKEMKNPGPFNRIRFERIVRQEMGMSLVAWRRHGDDIMAEVNKKHEAMTDMDYQQLLLSAQQG